MLRASQAAVAKDDDDDMKYSRAPLDNTKSAQQMPSEDAAKNQPGTEKTMPSDLATAEGN